MFYITNALPAWSTIIATLGLARLEASVYTWVPSYIPVQLIRRSMMMIDNGTIDRANQARLSLSIHITSIN